MGKFKVGDRVRRAGTGTEDVVVDLDKSGYPILSRDIVTDTGWCGGLEKVTDSPPQSESPTLRDQFAMAALTGILASGAPDPDNSDFETIAHASYIHADAMLKARES